MQFGDGMAEHLEQGVCVGGAVRSLGFKLPGEDGGFQGYPANALANGIVEGLGNFLAFALQIGETIRRRFGLR